jgi:hypothetical protein
MNSIRAAYVHIARTRPAHQRVIYALWTVLMIVMTMYQSWLIGLMAAIILVVGIPVFVYNDEHVTRRRCVRPSRRTVPVKGIARAAGG